MRENGVRVLSDRVTSWHIKCHGRPSRDRARDYVFLGLKAHSYRSCGPLWNPARRGHGSAGARKTGGCPLVGTSQRIARGHYRGRRIRASIPVGATSAVLSPGAGHRLRGLYPATTIEGSR